MNDPVRDRDISEECEETRINWALMDPSKWGWTALGGVACLIPPHENSRRRSTRSAYLRQARKKRSTDAGRTSNGEPMSGQNEEGIGVSTQRRESVSEEKDSAANKQYRGANISGEKSVKFRALSDGQLDTLMYHRGRDGFELRDEKSGDLLCASDPTDTGRGAHEPRHLAVIALEFPLEDGDNPMVFREDVQWDLANPQTPTPMQFALNLSDTYGLSFSQTMDLSRSIQLQLRAFVTENCSYAPPVSIQASSFKPQQITPSLYGETTGEITGGRWHSANSLRTKAVLPEPIPCPLPVNRGGKRKRESMDGSDRPSEPLYRREVQSRLRTASEKSIREKWDATDKSLSLGAIISLTNARCHKCGEEGPYGSLPCGESGHTYCPRHLSEFLERVEESSKSSLPLCVLYCPVCSLLCTCQYCEKKLNELAHYLRKETASQATSVETTLCDDLVTRSRKDTALRKAKKPIKRKLEPARPRVPKVPPSDFPREVFKGVDIDPGDKTIYSTVYTRQGATVEEDEAEVAPASVASRTDGTAINRSTESSTSPEETIEANREPEVEPVPETAVATIVEDGSVDYCAVCKKFGNLLCCDFCPRAFHHQCILNDTSIDSSGEAWECPSCRKEKAGLPGDRIDGESYREVIGPSVSDDMETDMVEAIAIVYGMLVTLIDYDFGYMFMAPVDLVAIPTYEKVVKNPMDLGTICEHIREGKYASKFSQEANKGELILLDILKDIELVWHNCFLFNCEGSAIYRMAEVQKRRAKSMMDKSIGSRLTELIKRELGGYEEECRRYRESIKSTVTTKSTSKLQNGLTARNKITVKSKGGKGRPIAVFDPESGKVVKIYNMMYSVHTVIELFLELNHECEWSKRELDTENKVRSLVTRSSKNPRLRLFDYRWLFLDDLTKGRVFFNEDVDDDGMVFREAPAQSNVSKTIDTDPIEMIVGDSVVVFESIEVALAYGELTSPEAAVVRQGVRGLVSTDDKPVELSGKKWRKLAVPRNNSHIGPDILRLPGIIAAKKDTLCGRILVAFRTVQAAYEDWLRSLDSCLENVACSKSLEHFLKCFLDGSQNLDGLEWIRVESSHAVSQNGKTSSSSTDTASHPSAEQPLLSVETKSIKGSPSASGPQQQAELELHLRNGVIEGEP